MDGRRARGRRRSRAGARSAASHWEIWGGPTRITEVLAPRGRRPKGPVLVLTYRRLDPADVTVHKGIPVTTVARTLVDLTEVFDAHELANVIHEAAYRRLFDLQETCAAMERANGRRGSSGSRRDRDPPHRQHRDEEPGRSGFRELVKPEEPRSNVIVEGVEVDFFFPERRLVVEIDDPSHGRERSSARTRSNGASSRPPATRSCGSRTRRWRSGRCRC